MPLEILGHWDEKYLCLKKMVTPQRSFFNILAH